MKTCKTCNKEFELEHFNFQDKKTKRYRPYCKYCDRARAKKDYHDNREYKLVQQAEWKKRNNYKAPGGYKANPVSGVYMFINLETGERYIGSSKNVYRRRASWVVKNSHFDIEPEKCIWGVLEECDNYKEREHYYIEKYNPELNTNK